MRKRRKIIYLATFMSLTLLGFGILKFQIIKKPAESKTQPQIISKSEYGKLRDKMLVILNEKDAREAILFIKSKSEEDFMVGNTCHEFLHELGQLSFKKYGGFGEAMKYRDDFCVSGYIHGVIQAHFKKSDNILNDASSTCAIYPEGKHVTWQCNHGIGHGLMYFTGNDLPKSLKICKTLNSLYDKKACVNGVYMENFNSDHEMHPSKFVDSKNFYYPCDTFKDFKGECYSNAPIRFLSSNNYDFNKGFSWCGAIQSEFSKNCYLGMSSQMTRRNIARPQLVEQKCDQLKAPMNVFCIAGIVSWYVGYYADIKKAEEVCSLLKSNNRLICGEYIKEFQKEF